MGKMWPTVILPSNHLHVYYIGENPEDVHIEETREIDFEELFFHLDKGESVFVTLKPESKKDNDFEKDDFHDSHLSNPCLNGGL